MPSTTAMSGSTETVSRLAATAIASPADVHVRRRGVRADQLEHLVIDRVHDRQRLDDLINIATHILWINAIVLDTWKEGLYGFPQVISAGGDAFTELITREEVLISERTADLYTPRIKSRISTYLKGVTEDEVLAFIMDERPSQFYREALRIRVVKYSISLQAMKAVGNDANAEKPSHCTYALCKTRPDYLAQLGVELDENRDCLIVAVNVFDELLSSIQAGARSSSLSTLELRALEIKLKAVNDYYQVAYESVGRAPSSRQYLIDPASKTWWETNTEDDMNEPKQGATVSTAYPSSGNMRSNLNVLVPTVSLLSVIPAALAWSHGSARRGTTSDPDFYQAITGSLLQLLSLTTFIWPTLGHPRLSKLNWFWIWLLASFSAVCAVVTIPFLLLLPAMWSFVTAFTSAVCQAIIQLQVINSI